MLPAPVLAVGDYVLRPWAPSDVDLVLRAASDPDIGRYSPVGAASTPASALAWIGSRSAPDRLDWVVESPIGPVGRVSLAHIELDDLVAEVGYWVLAAHRRQGVATSALTAIETYAFESLGLYRLYIRHEPENLPSCALATARNYRAEGTQRGAFARAGERRDLHVHAILVADQQ
jgi:[ribosomal protein S5]-alanine N-acetyltransferase